MLAYAVVGLVLTFQVLVSFGLWRSDIYERSEKSHQLKLIWALPFLGAVFVLVMLWDEHKHNQLGG